MTRSGPLRGRGHRRRRRGPGIAHTRARHLPHAVLHAGRHPGRGQVPVAPPTTSDLGAEIVLGNTYHLMLRPGAETVAALGGLGRFTGWDGLDADRLRRLPGLLARARRSTTTASRSAPPTTARSHRLTPESAVATQELLGADIQMVLDVCPPLPSPARGDPPRGRADRGVGRAGPGRPRAAPTRPCSASCRAASTTALRAESARAHRRARLRRLRHRRAVGGRDPRRDAAGARPPRSPTCPADRPRYLMGVGDPASLVEAVALGVDQFDCVHADPARPPRHRPHRRRAGCTSRTPATPAATSPSTRTARCEVCARHSRGYLRHLFQVGEPTAWPPALLAQPGLDARPDGPDAGTPSPPARSTQLRREILAVWG